MSHLGPLRLTGDADRYLEAPADRGHWPDTWTMQRMRRDALTALAGDYAGWRRTAATAAAAVAGCLGGLALVLADRRLVLGPDTLGLLLRVLGGLLLLAALVWGAYTLFTGTRLVRAMRAWGRIRPQDRVLTATTLFATPLVLRVVVAVLLLGVAAWCVVQLQPGDAGDGPVPGRFGLIAIVATCAVASLTTFAGVVVVLAGQRGGASGGASAGPASSGSSAYAPGAPAQAGGYGYAPPGEGGGYGYAPPADGGGYGYAPPADGGGYGQVPPADGGGYGQAPGGGYGYAPGAPADGGDLGFAPGQPPAPRYGPPDPGQTGHAPPAADPTGPAAGPPYGYAPPPPAPAGAPPSGHSGVAEPSPWDAPPAGAAPGATPWLPPEDRPDPTPALPDDAEHTRLVHRAAPEDSATRAVRPRDVTVVLDDGRHLPGDATCLLGRAPQPRADEAVDALVQLADPAVSKTHLAVRVEQGHVWVTDRASTNGSVLVGPDGTRRELEAWQETPVIVGAEVHLGTTVLRVLLPGDVA